MRILFFFSLLLCCANGAAQELLRQPYLQSVWADSAAILWKTDSSATACSVRCTYMKNQRFLLFFKRKKQKVLKVQGTLYDHAGAKYNEVVFKNLQPNTTYFYEVFSNGKRLAGGADYYFTTAPKEHRPAAFSFFAMGDIGEVLEHGSHAEASAERIHKLSERPDFGLGLGDIVYPEGESERYDEQLFLPFEEVFKNIPFYPVVGNHDWRRNPDENFAKEWRLPNNEHYFSFAYANAFFVGLDSRDGDFFEKNKQVAWLENELKEARKKYDWIIVFLHHNGKTCTYKSNYSHVISLYKTFVEYDVDLVLNGHAHTYERLKPYDAKGNVAFDEQHRQYANLKDAFVSITIGAGGKLNYNWKPDVNNRGNCVDGTIVAHAEHQACFGLFSIEGKTLRLKAYNSWSGEVFDAMEIRKD